MDHEFVVESGTPTIKDGKLRTQLSDSGTPQAHAGILSTTRFLHYGIFEARLRTNTPNPGAVAAFIGVSNLLDEIDFEWASGKPGHERETQANWYFHGYRNYTKDYGSAQSPDNLPTSHAFHTYRVSWSAESIEWSIDGSSFFSLVRADMGDQAFRFPVSPMRISFGIWHARNNQWAGSDPPNVLNWDAPSAADGIHVEFEWIKIVGQGCDQDTLSPGFEKQRQAAKSNDLRNKETTSAILLCIVALFAF